MIQFNLLPDVKVQFIKARKAKNRVTAISILVVAASITLLLLMVSATAFQRRHISDLNKDISTYESGLQGTDDLAKILTIQNQLNTLPALYAKRPVTSRLFGYVQSTTPAQVNMSTLKLSFDDTTLEIQGTADSLESVNRYVDTLKFTTYTVKDSADSAPVAPFKDVTLSSFTRDDKTASFSVKLTFDPVIFESDKQVTLSVPKTITTRSETQLPSSGLFDEKAAN